MWLNMYHPDYGYPNFFRWECLVLADVLGVKQAAKIKNVSTVSIYKWRKEMKESRNV